MKRMARKQSLASLRIAVGGVFAIGLGLSVLMAGTSAADADPVKERKELMKTVGKNTKLTGGMVRGKVPFDGEKAAAAMTEMAEISDKFVKLFPAGSDTDPETEAAPKIWTDMKGFIEKSNQFKADVTAAAAAAKSGEGPFKAAFGKAVANCKACHQDYRIKK